MLFRSGTPAELYARPKNLFVAGFIGSPAMNFMPGTIADGKVKLPFGEVKLKRKLSEGGGGREVLVGARPESFEDAALVGDHKSKGHTFKATIDLVESMGSELYAYFKIEGGEGVQSKELEELAADSGAAEVPGSGTNQVVARLDPASKVERGKEAELWLDTRALHFFDPQGGDRLGGGAEEGSRSGSDEKSGGLLRRRRSKSDSGE